MAFHAPDLANAQRDIDAGDIVAGFADDDGDPFTRVGRAADDLLDAFVGIDLTNPQAVSIRVLLGLEDLAQSKGANPVGGVNDVFDLQPQIGQSIRDLGHRGVRIEVVFQPGEGEFHGCASNETKDIKAG